jgi:hypothetical protein
MYFTQKANKEGRAAEEVTVEPMLLMLLPPDNPPWEARNFPLPPKKLRLLVEVEVVVGRIDNRAFTCCCRCRLLPISRGDDGKPIDERSRS